MIMKLHLTYNSFHVPVCAADQQPPSWLSQLAYNVGTKRMYTMS